VNAFKLLPLCSTSFPSTHKLPVSQDVIADAGAKIAEDLLIKRFMKQDLEKMLDTLGTKEKNVIQWRFGLEDGRMKTLQEIGELLGVSRERIRQIEISAFRKLQNEKKTEGMEQYFLS